MVSRITDAFSKRRGKKSIGPPQSLRIRMTEAVSLCAKYSAAVNIAKYWDGLKQFLDDGRIEINSNTIERTTRPIAVNRENALFAGHNAGAENRATVASLTCKLNAVDLLAYLTSTLTAIVNDHRQSQIDELLP